MTNYSDETLGGRAAVRCGSCNQHGFVEGARAETVIVHTKRCDVAPRERTPIPLGGATELNGPALGPTEARFAGLDTDGPSPSVGLVAAPSAISPAQPTTPSDLIGSEKQVVWAEKIRGALRARWQTLVERPTDPLISQENAAIFAAVVGAWLEDHVWSQRAATWWIDNRNVNWIERAANETRHEQRAARAATRPL